MRVVKKINNNVALCVDRKGQEIVAFGRGIGFPPMPYEAKLEQIERTFYRIDSKYLPLLSELPEPVVQFTAAIVDKASMRLQYELNPNLVITLSDHIAFCLQRAKQGIFIQMPLVYELEQNYPQEVELGKYTVRELEKRFQVRLHKNEISGIALSFINARNMAKEGVDTAGEELPEYEKILDDTIEIVEERLHIKISRDSFNFARYTSHLMYLLKRVYRNETINTGNAELYEEISREFPEISDCVDEFDAYFQRKWNHVLSREEKLYLIMHVNRITVREGGIAGQKSLAEARTP